MKISSIGAPLSWWPGCSDGLINSRGEVSQEISISIPNERTYPAVIALDEAIDRLVKTSLPWSASIRMAVTVKVLLLPPMRM